MVLVDLIDFEMNFFLGMGVLWSQATKLHKDSVSTDCIETEDDN